MGPGGFAAALGRAAARLPEPAFAAGAAGPGWIDLAAPGDAPAAWMAATTPEHPGMGADVAAAFVAGRLAAALAEALAALALGDGSGPAPDLAVAAAPESYPWEDEGRSGLAMRFRLRLDGAAPGPADPPALAAALAGALDPTVAALARRGRVGRVALWRQAADAAAYGCLHVGRDLGDVGAGVALGRALLAAPGPLRSPRAAFARVEAAGAAEWFLLRGGCCRVFSCPGEGYCSTCVHRPAAERRALLAAWLARRRAGAAA